MKTPALTSAYIFDKNVQFKFSRGKSFRVPKDRPLLSILIPTYNRAAKLDSTLGRLGCLRYRIRRRRRDRRRRQSERRW